MVRGRRLNRSLGVMRIIAAILLAGLPVIVDAEAVRKCSHRSASFFDEALSEALKNSGVAHTLDQGKGICAAGSEWPAIDAAAEKVDGYFFGAQALLTSACEE